MLSLDPFCICNDTSKDGLENQDNPMQYKYIKREIFAKQLTAHMHANYHDGKAK